MRQPFSFYTVKNEAYKAGYQPHGVPNAHRAYDVISENEEIGISYAKKHILYEGIAFHIPL